MPYLQANDDIYLVNATCLLGCPRKWRLTQIVTFNIGDLKRPVCTGLIIWNILFYIKLQFSRLFLKITLMRYTHDHCNLSILVPDPFEYINIAFMYLKKI